MLTGLMSGNFRSWGPTQYRQYRALFLGQYVGLEIESTQTNITEETIRLLMAAPFTWSYVNGRRRGSEVQVLLDITDPIKFRYMLGSAWRTLGAQRFELMGSLHINIDASPYEENAKIRRLCFLNYHGNVAVRENKFCIASPNVKVVMAQIIMNFLSGDIFNNFFPFFLLIYLL